jgi:cysteinyl-tRNA synthetase
MAEAHSLMLYNTLTRRKEEFVPLDASNVRMYVCGPTVYDYAHIGNARPVIVFDVLFRLLRHLYGDRHVTYVRNITDVDDKINARAVRDYPGLGLNEAIRKVTDSTAAQFQADAKALGCLLPTHQPRATEFVLPRDDDRVDMKTLIQKLLDKGNAYVAEGVEGKEVLFEVASMPDYGSLSRRNLEDQKAGARVSVDAHKRHPEDFVLWKESGVKEPGWEGKFKPQPDSGYDAEFTVSPANARELGRNSREITIHGRPGWHIECSAMSAAYLGEVFDIHGGGLDLIFPHHENEIAQSRCAHGTEAMARYWMHNGFLQVEGEKMSKSLGNFITIHDLLKDWPGDVIRLNMLRTHYRQPIDWTLKGLTRASADLLPWAEYLTEEFHGVPDEPKTAGVVDVDLVKALTDDLNTPLALAALHAQFERSLKLDAPEDFLASLSFLGFYQFMKPGIFHPSFVANMFESGPQLTPGSSDHIHILQFRAASANSMVEFAASTRTGLEERGFLVELNDTGVLFVGNLTGAEAEDAATARIEEFIRQRNSAKQAKDYVGADLIRAKLSEMGVVLKDAKDPETGEIVTTWELAR